MLEGKEVEFVAVIERGDRVLALSASGRELEKRALTGAVMGADFEVVWVVRPEEWEAAESEGREPEAVPWPSSDVHPVPYPRAEP